MKRECCEHGVKAESYGVDLLAEKEIEEVKERVLTTFGGVDILVHSAGMIVLSKVAAAASKDFELQFRCNVLAPFSLTQGRTATPMQLQSMTGKTNGMRRSS